MRFVFVQRRFGRALAACLFATFVLVGGNAAGGEAVASRSISGDVQTFVTVQSAEGVPGLSLPLAQAIGEHMAKRADIRSREYLAAHGKSSAELPKAESAATLLQAGGERVGVIRIQQGELHQMVVVVAIRDDQLLRIACTRLGSDPVPVTFGPCADKIKETLGFALVAG
jgi:hypothetical protein